jgi:hypothetical protein
MLFSSVADKMPTKGFLKLHFHPSSKIKSQKEVKNSRNQGFSYFFAC